MHDCDMWTSISIMYSWACLLPAHHVASYFKSYYKSYCISHYISYYVILPYHLTYHHSPNKEYNITISLQIWREWVVIMLGVTAEWELWEVSYRDKWHERACKGPPLTCQDLLRPFCGTSIWPPVLWPGPSNAEGCQQTGRFLMPNFQRRDRGWKLVDENDEMYILYLFRALRALTFFYHRHTAYCLRGWQNIPAINFLNLRPNKTKGLWPLWPSRRVAVDISLTRRRQFLKLQNPSDVSENSADEVPKGAKVKTVDRRPWVSKMWKVRKHVLLLKIWGLFLTHTYSSQVSSMVDQDEGRPERREEGGSFFVLRKR